MKVDDKMTDGLPPKQAEIRGARQMRSGTLNYQLYRNRPFVPFIFISGVNKSGLNYGIPKIKGFLELLGTVPLPSNAHILDIGCGGGWTSEWLARWGP